VIVDYPYQSGELTLRPGGWLCAVSDGVTEAMNPGNELYGATRLLAALAASESSEPRAVLAEVRESVRRFAGEAEQSDDVTLVCARWNGASGR
jgi:sigma-B regulation protein RsbU (phosphoserine phosphatase)